MDSNHAPGPNGAGDEHRPLRTEPRPLWFHVMVDGLIGFTATAIVLFFVGAPLWVMIVVGWLIGLVAGPFTRRIDERQLAERAADGDAERT